MRKPSLGNFGLNEDSLEKYEKQKRRYGEILENIEQSRVKYNWAVLIICAIIVVVSFIVWCVNEFDDFFAIFLFCSFWGISPLILLIFGIWNWSTSFSKWKKDFLCSVMGYSSDKSKYVDPILEKRVLGYRAAMEEFDQCEKRMKVEFWKNMSGLQFEKEVAELYKQYGYKTLVTRATGDGGVDIILLKDDERIAVQCKHHKNKIGPNDVRALQGVVLNESYSYGIFVSLSGFTPTVSDELQRSKVKIELVDMYKLIALQKKLDLIE